MIKNGLEPHIYGRHTRKEIFHLHSQKCSVLLLLSMLHKYVYSCVRMPNEDNANDNVVGEKFILREALHLVEWIFYCLAFGIWLPCSMVGTAVAQVTAHDIISLFRNVHKTQAHFSHKFWITKNSHFPFSFNASKVSSSGNSGKRHREIN